MTIRNHKNQPTTPKHKAIEAVIDAINTALVKWKDEQPGITKGERESIHLQLQKISYRVMTKCLGKEVSWVEAVETPVNNKVNGND